MKKILLNQVFNFSFHEFTIKPSIRADQVHAEFRTLKWMTTAIKASQGKIKDAGTSLRNWHRPSGIRFLPSYFFPDRRPHHRREQVKPTLGYRHGLSTIHDTAVPLLSSRDKPCKGCIDMRNLVFFFLPTFTETSTPGGWCPSVPHSARLDLKRTHARNKT